MNLTKKDTWFLVFIVTCMIAIISISCKSKAPASPEPEPTAVFTASPTAIISSTMTCTPTMSVTASATPSTTPTSTVTNTYTPDLTQTATALEAKLTAIATMVTGIEGLRAEMTPTGNSLYLYADAVLADTTQALGECGVTLVYNQVVYASYLTSGMWDYFNPLLNPSMATFAGAKAILDSETTSINSRIIPPTPTPAPAATVIAQLENDIADRQTIISAISSQAANISNISVRIGNSITNLYIIRDHFQFWQAQPYIVCELLDPSITYCPLNQTTVDATLADSQAASLFFNTGLPGYIADIEAMNSELSSLFTSEISELSAELVSAKATATAVATP